MENTFKKKILLVNTLCRGGAPGGENSGVLKSSSAADVQRGALCIWEAREKKPEGGAQAQGCSHGGSPLSYFYVHDME